MIRIFHHYVPAAILFLWVTEVFVLGLSVEAAAYLNYHLDGREMVPLAERLPQSMLFVTVVPIAMTGMGLYDPLISRRLKNTVLRIALALWLGAMLLAVIFYFLPHFMIWRSIFLTSLGFSGVGILAVRSVFTGVADNEKFKRRVLVLGAGRKAAKLIKRANAGNSGDFIIDSCVRVHPDEKNVQYAADLDALHSLRAFASERGVREIVLAMDDRRERIPSRQLVDCRMNGIRVLDPVSFLEQEHGFVDLAALNPSWLIFAEGFIGANMRARLAKRAFDVTAALGVLFVTLPILILAALAIKTASKGPLFYRQERIGRFGEPFEVLKFRTMCEDAEADGTPRWAEANDPRITAVGKFLRLARIDELPQIFNVLRGEMSFVGPRPERPFFVETLASQIPFYNERHLVKPGITGWAQVNYPYGATEEDSRRKLEYDLYYIKNYSLFLDFIIIVQTLKVVLSAEGAR